MIRIYERSLCQSYASAYRAGIKIGEVETREDALKQVEAMTEDSYQCFAVDDDGTCIDLTGTFPGCLAGVMAWAATRMNGRARGAAGRTATRFS